MENTTRGSPTLIAVGNDELSMKIRWIFYVIIYPIISIVGISANGTSVVIISRKGFRKSSNILLVALAISDIMFLIGLNNITRNIIFTSVPQALHFSQTVNYILYILNLTFLMLNYVGTNCSMVIPAPITCDRLLAIFTPLKFTRIVTPIRTLCVILFIVILFTVCFIYDDVVCLGFKQITVQGSSLGIMYLTKKYYNDVSSGLYQVFADFINNITGAIPIIIVTMGSFVIWVKVTIIITKRKQLKSSRTSVKTETTQAPISRTTKTLLCVCILYIVCSGFLFVAGYAGMMQGSLKLILNSFNDLIISINGIGNFIIYVALNKSFKTTYVRSLDCCRKIKQNRPT
jgi:hypothetical protein